MAESQSTTIYRDVPGFPGYRVSSDGGAWTSLKKVGRGHGGGAKYETGDEWRRLTPTPNRSGHLWVRLRGKRKYVHHLVLEVFVGPRPAGMEACHFPDPDPANNSVHNLRWATHADNEADKLLHGTDNRSERNGQAKLDVDRVRALRRDYGGGMTCTELSRKYGISRTQTRRIVSRQRWACLP